MSSCDLNPMKEEDGMRMSILGKEWTVVEVKRIEGDGNMGRALQVPLRIYLRKDMPPDNMKEVLIHEIVEAINMELEVGLNEKQVTAVSIGLNSCSALRLDLLSGIRGIIDRP